MDKFTTFGEIFLFSICAPWARDEHCVRHDVESSIALMCGSKETEVSPQHEPPLQGFTNPSMQIHVQNAPFVYNPDTISVGLGFTEGGEKKRLLENSTSNMKVGVVLFSFICLFAVIVFLGCQCFFSPLPSCVTSHQRADSSGEASSRVGKKNFISLASLALWCDNSYSSRQE